MGVSRSQRGGFTLVELLIVIAVIVILMAILLPVFNGARRRARQTTCMANLHSIAQAIRMYRMEEGAYPGPPELLTDKGGLNALYPTYLTSRKLLICPDDPIQSGEDYLNKDRYEFRDKTNLWVNLLQSHLWRDQVRLNSAYGAYWQEASAGALVNRHTTFPNVYSSYNRYYDYYGYAPKSADLRLLNYNVTQHVEPGESLTYLYTWYRYDPQNKLDLDHSINLSNSTSCYANFECVDRTLGYNLARQIFWLDYPNNPDNNPLRLQDRLGRPLWDWPEEDLSNASDGVHHSAYLGYMSHGVYSAVFPGLANRNAPDNTIITRCPNHRQFTKVKNEGKDLVLRLDGSVALVPVLDSNYDWALQSEQTQ